MKEKIIKYVKTLFFCILIFNFAINFFSFFTELDSYLLPGKIEKNPTDSKVLGQAQSIETNLNDLTKDLKSDYGEEYPALGVAYLRIISLASSKTIIQNFLFGLIAGFGFGNIIYFIFIAKYKKSDLFFALLISLFISSFFLGLSDILTYMSNGEKFKFTLKNVLYNMELTAIPFIIISVILIIFNKIYTTYMEIRYSD